MRRIKLKPIQVIALGFAVIILTGTLLLMLPISQKPNAAGGFLDCLFTATSATCVTGLVIADTFANWTLFGQIVILIMIQIGGIGFMSVAAMFSMLLRRKIGLAERNLLRESANAGQLGGIVKLTRKILLGTVIFEGVGAVLLSIRFIPKLGFGNGVYYAVFHSISAFCNAGFDLFGGVSGKYSSLTAFRGDVLVNITIIALIVIGGIGFIVWSDISEHKWHFKKYMVHTKIVLVMSGVLLFGGALLIYLFERNSLFADLSVKDTILSSLFHSATCRTAGFNTLDTAKMSTGTCLTSNILMFIGGSSGSTAGGIKTTTVVVMILSVISAFKKDNNLNIFGRRLEPDATRKALSVFMTNLSLIFIAMMIISLTQGFSFPDLLTECCSAISTVGMSTGITRDLNSLSRVVVILLMYAGRVGSLSFAMSFAADKNAVAVLPETKINIG